MVAVVQLVRASDCGSECRGFESHLPPQEKRGNSAMNLLSFFVNQFVKLKILPYRFSYPTDFP